MNSNPASASTNETGQVIQLVIGPADVGAEGILFLDLDRNRVFKPPVVVRFPELEGLEITPGLSECFRENGVDLLVQLVPHVKVDGSATTIPGAHLRGISLRGVVVLDDEDWRRSKGDPSGKGGRLRILNGTLVAAVCLVRGPLFTAHYSGRKRGASLHLSWPNALPTVSRFATKQSRCGNKGIAERLCQVTCPATLHEPEQDTWPTFLLPFRQQACFSVPTGCGSAPQIYCGSCLFVHGHFTLLFVRRTDAILRLSVSQQFCRFPPDQSLLFPDNLLLVLSGFCICDSSGSRHLFAQAPTVYAFSNIGNGPEVWPTHRELTFGNCFATLN
jgi:hypothetical protein